MAEAETIDSEELSPDDLHDLTLLLGISPEADTVFADYLEHVANDGLRPYKAVIQYSESEGGKAGESLYTHVLNGIFVLEQLRRLLPLSEVETRVLFTAFTIHDINKVIAKKAAYNKLVTREHAIPQITNLKLDCFFPGYETYLEDIFALMKQHSAHQWTGMEALDLRRTADYQLDTERRGHLVFLMRAADGIDLSHRLDESRHKENFLFQLNSFSDTQYVFVMHRVSEQRGSFTNIVHNAVMEELQERFDLTPLLLYPDGVTYLCPRARQSAIAVNDDVIMAIARRVAASINTMTSKGFSEFIRPINMGITVDPKCLDLNIPFGSLLDAILSIIQKRTIKADKLQRLADDSVKRTRKALPKYSAALAALHAADDQAADPHQILAGIEALLASGPVPQTQDGMRIGELLRSYYIFLLEHCAEHIATPWSHIYELLELPAERRMVYEGFDARMDRAYAIATELSLSEREVYTRIKHDGTALLDSQERADPRLPLLIEYLGHVLVFSDNQRAPADFAGALPTYVRQQHKQCVQCSLPLPTEKWMSGDVRSDVKVQLFSNRLGGGPGEPKKRVCSICQLQFLVEKLNYREIRNEHTVYLHLFPYSFLTAPFLNGLRGEIKRINRQDMLTGALRLNDVAAAVRERITEQAPQLSFTTLTKEHKPQPYGVYLPRYSDTLGGMMIFPINPAGGNDTQKFLFVLQHALLLHHHFGCKVLVSTAVTPPLDANSFGDVYFDFTPLSVRGLIRQNDYHTYQQGTREKGSLWRLWEQLGHLFAIRGQVALPKGDPMAELVAAMANHPLQVFYVAEKLAGDKVRTDKKAGEGWIIRTIADHVRDLALSIGGTEMQELDEQLQRLADIAWQGRLRGQSLEKNSLMAPMDEVLRKLGVQSQELNTAVLRAAAIQDLYDHIERILKANNQRYSPPRLLAASEEFVQVFFEDIFDTIYQGKVARLLSHEKILRSAFHFYIRRRIPRKAPTANGTPAEGNAATEKSHTDDTDRDAS